MEHQLLKYRSVPLTQEDFDCGIRMAVAWEDIALDHYIACHRFPNADGPGKDAFWAHDAIVKRKLGDRCQVFNPGRHELSDYFQISFGGYGTNWCLVKPGDYSGPQQ